MRLGQRLKVVRKVLTRRNPYLFIDVKPAGMVRERGPDYVYRDILRGFEALLPEMKANLASLAPYTAEIGPGNTIHDGAGVEVPFANGYFTGHDARLAYALVRRYRPARIVEVGSGHSTHFFRKAVRDSGLDTRIVCIDPAPRRAVESAADDLHRVSFTEADMGVYDGLAANEVVFLDGSHFAFNGTDVPHFFLNLLPRIPKGVFVHVHDIQLPYEYDEIGTARHYNEQYLLGVLLLNAADWTPFLPVHYLRRVGALPADEGGSSFWMRRD